MILLDFLWNRERHKKTSRHKNNNNRIFPMTLRMRQDQWINVISCGKSACCGLARFPFNLTHAYRAIVVLEAWVNFFFVFWLFWAYPRSYGKCATKDRCYGFYFVQIWQISGTWTSKKSLANFLKSTNKLWQFAPLVVHKNWRFYVGKGVLLGRHEGVCLQIYFL